MMMLKKKATKLVAVSTPYIWSLVLSRFFVVLMPSWLKHQGHTFMMEDVLAAAVLCMDEDKATGTSPYINPILSHWWGSCKQAILELSRETTRPCVIYTDILRCQWVYKNQTTSTGSYEMFSVNLALTLKMCYCIEYHPWQQREALS